MVLRNFMKTKRILIFVIFILSCSTLLSGCNINTKYDIERVFTDDTFKNIIEGKTKPVEIIVGFGGENGYESFSTKDPAVIDEYINAFRNVTIEEEIKDKDKMIRVWDDIVDFTFKMDDETSITVGTDLVQYVTDYDRGIQYKLGNTDAIINLNRCIDRDEGELLE